MLRPGRQRYVDETNSTTSTSANNSVTTTRMVDICLALNLEDTAREVVTRSWATWPDNLRSLNQTVSYIRIRPLFLDIEIKQLNQDREPLVQLGIWMAGLYQKRKLHGWDQSAPMPGLVVNGDRWDLYIGFARGDGVVCSSALLLLRHFSRFIITDDLLLQDHDGITHAFWLDCHDSGHI